MTPKICTFELHVRKSSKYFERTNMLVSHKKVASRVPFSHQRWEGRGESRGVQRAHRKRSAARVHHVPIHYGKSTYYIFLFMFFIYILIRVSIITFPLSHYHLSC